MSGPADATPDSVGDLTPAWLDDWLTRAKRSLEQAADDAKKRAEEVRDRAKAIAKNVESGAKTLASLPGQAIDTARGALEKLVETAQRIQWTITFASIGVTVILGLAFSRYMGWI